MRAVVLAGGKGTRLKPYTTVIPKPLVPVGNRTILEILIGRLKKCGITELTICVNHLAELIMSYFGSGDKWGVKIEYSIFVKLLGTVAPIRMIKNLPENFLVMNGDLLTDLDFRKLYNYHLKNKSLITIATYKRATKIDFGVIEIDKSKNIVLDFKEKPEYELNVSMGVYVLNRRILSNVPLNKQFGFDDLMLTLLTRKQTIKVYPYSGYWLDIGRPDDYEKANEEIEKLDL
ncbi:D-glycero-alpha-D-manno-heptose 1-phosphate guanylyltransferase [subsurface metagenome]